MPTESDCYLTGSTHVLFIIFDVFPTRRGKDKTFRARKQVPERTHQRRLQKYAEVTLGSGNLKLAVQLPEGEDLREWLAVHSNNKYIWILILVNIMKFN